jgi:hypothetical protein
MEKLNDNAFRHLKTLNSWFLLNFHLHPTFVKPLSFIATFKHFITLRKYYSIANQG